MHSFQDEHKPESRIWEIVVDAFTIEKVRGRLGVNFYDLNKAREELYADPPRFVHALYLLCFDQTAGKVTERKFCEGWTLDTIRLAREALDEELVFFSRSAARNPLRKTRATAQKNAA